VSVVDTPNRKQPQKMQNEINPQWHKRIILKTWEEKGKLKFPRNKKMAVDGEDAISKANENAPPRLTGRRR